MAMRRMISRRLAESDRFLDLPLAARGLYLHLVTSADDDGLLGGVRALLRMAGATERELSALVEGGFLLALPDGVYAVRHWLSQNRMRRDRYTPTIYTAQLEALDVDASGNYFLKSSWQPSIGQVKSDQDSSGQDSPDQDKPVDRRMGSDGMEPDRMPRGRADSKPGTDDGSQLADYFAQLFGCAMGRSLRQALDSRLAEGVPAADIRQAIDRAHTFGPRDPCAYFRTLLRRLTPAPPAAALAAPAPLADWEKDWLDGVRQRQRQMSEVGAQPAAP